METKKTNRPRFFEISLLNVFLCLLVIFIHVSSKPVTTLDKNSLSYLAIMLPWRLSSFVVYGFIFLSGLKLLMTKSDGFSYRKFLLGRFFSIAVPYILWVFIYYIYFCLKNYFPFRLVDLVRYIFVGDLVGHFYFVITIIQFYILAPLWIRLTKKINGALLITFSLILTLILAQNLPDIVALFDPDFHFLYTDRIFTTYLFYWVAGCCAGLNYEKFKESLRHNRTFIAICFAASCAANAFLSYLSLSEKKHIPWLENVHVVYTMSAVLFFFTLALWLTQKLPQNSVPVRLINNVDKVSYGIYLSHCLILFMTDDLLSKIKSLPMGASFLIRLFVVCAAAISACLFWRGALLNRIKKLAGSRPTDRPS